MALNPPPFCQVTTFLHDVNVASHQVAFLQVFVEQRRQSPQVRHVTQLHPFLELEDVLPLEESVADPSLP